MKILIAKNIKPMGELDQKFGQVYWGSVHDQEIPVRFNLMNPVSIEDGAKIQAEEYVIKTSGSGKEYMQLRRVKVEGGAQTPPSDAMKMLKLIYDTNQEILAILKMDTKTIPEEEEDVVVDVDPDEEIDLSQIPF